MTTDNKVRESIDGSTVFVALKDGVDKDGKPDVQGLLVKTPPGGGWQVAQDNGVSTLTPDQNKPQPDVQVTSVNRLNAENPSMAAITRLDGRSGGNIDFAKTQTGFTVGGATPGQGLPVPETEIQRALSDPLPAAKPAGAQR